jgi:molecular chaperone DnaJ
VRERKNIQVHIPAGVDTGSRLRVSGEGDSGARGGPPGDLYVVLHVKPHDIFERDGDDLYCEVQLPMDIAVIGGQITVPTIGGPCKMKIPAGTQSGTVMRLRKKGIPSLRGHGRGDQHVKIMVEVPTHLNNEQQELIKQFAELTSERNYPLSDKFRKKSSQVAAES